MKTLDLLIALWTERANQGLREVSGSAECVEAQTFAECAKQLRAYAQHEASTAELERRVAALERRFEHGYRPLREIPPDGGFELSPDARKNLNSLWEESRKTGTRWRMLGQSESGRDVFEVQREGSQFQVFLEGNTMVRPRLIERES